MHSGSRPSLPATALVHASTYQLGSECMLRGSSQLLGGELDTLPLRLARMVTKACQERKGAVGSGKQVSPFAEAHNAKVK